MKKYILTLVLFYTFGSLGILSAETDNWQVEKSTHFIVYYKNAATDFIRQLIDKSEDYYNKIADDLGFRRFDFWLWDDRAKIYVYDNAQDFQSATGNPSWSAGVAMPGTKTIVTYPYAKGFFETTLAHEMSHIIFREFVGFGNYAVPLWLEEGVACYQEKVSSYSMINAFLRGAIQKGNFMTLERLSNFNPMLATDNQSVQLFYAEAFSIVNFLIKEFGKDKFVLFCQNLRDKKNLESAIISTFSFNNLKEFEEAWQKHLKNE